MKNRPAYQTYAESAEYIKSLIPEIPEFAVVLGSGLDLFVENVTDRVVIPYSDIPHFPVSTVSYQKGELIFGRINGKPVLLMNGRFHYYEGYEMWETAYPVGVFKILGIKKLIITNAAGGNSPEYTVGDLVIVKDHINLSGNSPLRGENIPEFGERFFDMQSVYDKDLAADAHRIAKAHGFEVKEGVYAFMPGPQYETPSEIKLLRLLGSTLVGMSTVGEVIFASQCKIPVLCISTVSNMAAGITGQPITEEEVLVAGAIIAEKMKALLTGIITGE